MAPAIVTPPPPPDDDGQLDCLGGEQYGVESDLAADATGHDAPGQAIEAFLLERALAFEIRAQAPMSGTVVHDDREVLRATAQQLPDGTYLVTRYGGCAAGPPGPDGTTPALAQPCPNPGPIYSEEPIGPLAQTGSFRQLFDEVVLDGGRRYSLRAHADGPVVLGAQVGTTECRIADGSWPDGRLRSGDATLLPIGTPLYAVDGEPVEETIAAEVDGERLVYQYVGLQGAAPLVTPSPAIPVPVPVPTTPHPTAASAPAPPTSTDGR